MVLASACSLCPYQLAESLVVVSYEPGEIIQHASTAGSTFYLIREGSALEVEGEAEDFTSLPYASASGGSDTNASALSAAYTASTSPMRQGHKPTATASGSSNVVRVRSNHILFHFSRALWAVCMTPGRFPGLC